MTNLSPALRLKQGRTKLLLDFPFFGVLILRLKDVETPSIETMATDGVSLFYNPEFVAKLTPPELLGCLAHEVMHPALQHHTRRGTRSAKRWNVACDFAINPLIRDANLALPAGALYDPRFRNLSAERIYNLIAEEEDGNSRGGQGDGSTNSGSGDPASQGEGQGTAVPVTTGGFGQVIDAPNPDQAGAQATSDQIEKQRMSWTGAVEQAEVIARMAGKTPAGLRRAMESAEKASVDWRAALRNSFAAAIPEDYTWSSPNRRHIDSGLYLPSIRKDGVGEIVIGIDCSGSINRRQLGLFQEEVNSIISERRPQRVHVIYFDTQVHSAAIFEQGEPVTLEPVGGGGTSFCPCFEYIEENALQPQALVVFTDLEGSFPDTAPNHRVLWAATKDHSAPFGVVIPMAAA
jgi:predicted metal-dependent peptidase